MTLNSVMYDVEKF